jgi:hypothetical protein
MAVMLVVVLAPTQAALALGFTFVSRDSGPVQALAKVTYSLRLDRTFENPYDGRQIKVWATVRRPNGQTDVVPAFWHQPHVVNDTTRTIVATGIPSWGIRYTPLAPGKHIVRFHAATGAGAGTRSEARSFTAAAASADARGFVKVSSEDRRYLTWSRSQQMFFPMGFNIDFPQFKRCDPAFNPSACLGGWEAGSRYPALVVADGSALGAADFYTTWAFYRDVINRLADAGGTAVRIRNDSWWLPLELPGPEGHVPDYPKGVPGFSIGRYHQANAAILDLVFTLAEQRGLAIQLVSWNANSKFGDADYALGGNEDLVKRRLTYVVARWGYSTSLYAYEYFNEVDAALTNQPFWAAVKAWHRGIDTNGHVITNSNATRSIAGNPVNVFDTDATHVYTMPGEDIQRVGDFTTSTKPLVMSEYGNRRYNTLPVDADPIGINAREGLWMAIVGHKSGALYWWTSTHVAPLDLFATIYRGPATFLRNENFAERTWVTAGLEHAGGPVGAVSFRGMVGDGAFLNAYIVRTPSSEIADRAPVDGVVLRASAVRPGTYTIRWYDQVTGAVIAERAAVADAQGLRLELPTGIARGVAVKAFPS